MLHLTGIAYCALTSLGYVKFAERCSLRLLLYQRACYNYFRTPFVLLSRSWSPFMHPILSWCHFLLWHQAIFASYFFGGSISQRRKTDTPTCTSGSSWLTPQRVNIAFFICRCNRCFSSGAYLVAICMYWRTRATMNTCCASISRKHTMYVSVLLMYGAAFVMLINHDQLFSAIDGRPTRLIYVTHFANWAKSRTQNVLTIIASSTSIFTSTVVSR